MVTVIADDVKMSLINGLRTVYTRLSGHDQEVSFGGEQKIFAKLRKPAIEGMLRYLNQKEKGVKSAKSNVMIDAETGYGKTYDIGLWSHILAQSGLHHLVAVQNNSLVDQAKEMIGGAFSVNVKTPSNVEEVKSILKDATISPTTIIVTHDMLFKQESDMGQSNLWISVDEVDSVNKQHSFENMCNLDEKYPTTYLTATPKRRILNRCQVIVSPTRSSRRCIANTIKTSSVIAKINKKEGFYRALEINIATSVFPSLMMLPIVRSCIVVYFSQICLTLGFPLFSWPIYVLSTVVASLLLSLASFTISWVICKITGSKSLGKLLPSIFTTVLDSVWANKSSPAHEYVEKCEEVFTYNKIIDTDDLLKSIRWNVQSPIGESALILADDLDSVINLNFALQGKSNEVYENGNIYERHAIYDLFQPHGTSYQDYRLNLCKENFIKCVKKQHSNLTKGQLSQLVKKVDFSNTAQYLKYRVMHSVINLTLSYLVKCDDAALDKQRKEDLSKLISDVVGKIKNAAYGDIVKFLVKKGFSKKFAIEKLLPEMNKVIQVLHRSHDNQRKLIVDNWNLSTELHDLMKPGNVLNGLSSFCERNKCIFAGIEKNDLDIERNKSFFKVKYNDDKKCKVEYCSYEEQDFNALAKCALTTIIDGSKSRGFDSEYNHVASIFIESCSQFNNPTEALQNLGRNREKNAIRQPWFFASAGERAELFIDEVLVNLNNHPEIFCEKVLFPVVNRYNKLVKSRMGVKIGRKIETYISENMGASGNIRDFSYRLVQEVYESVHEMNDFNIEKTREDLRKILKSTEKYLCSYADRVKNEGKFSLKCRAILFIVRLVSQIIDYMWFAVDHIIFAVKSYSVNEKTDSPKVLAYAHLVKNYNILEVSKQQRIFSGAFSIARNMDKRFTDQPCYNYSSSECMKRIASIFQNKVYIDALGKLLSPLSSKKGGEHLLTVLNAIYPYAIDNEQKRDKVVQFKKDLKCLGYEALVNKYCESDTYHSTDLYKIAKWIMDINLEITQCQCYYYSDIACAYAVPKLKTNHRLFGDTVILPDSSSAIFLAKFVVIYALLLYLSYVSIVPMVFDIVLGVYISYFASGDFWGFRVLSLINQYDTKFAVNELVLLSKQSEVQCMKNVASELKNVELSRILSDQQPEQHLQNGGMAAVV